MIFLQKYVTALSLMLVTVTLARLIFVFIDDPEGPNLLVVAVTAVVLYVLTTGLYVFSRGKSLRALHFVTVAEARDFSWIWFIGIEVLVAGTLYLAMTYL